jgi:circadian clock protein KaiC
MDDPAEADERKIASGTPGLDRVLDGGFIRGQTTLLSGGPGTGKTILGLQFLAAADGPGLYIGFEEREVDIRHNAAELGIDLSDVTILDLSAAGDRFFSTEEYSVFTPEEVEGEDLLERIAAAIDAESPDRLVIDPLTELRSMLPDEFRFRRNISSLINELKDREITMLCTTQYSSAGTDRDLQFLGDAAIEIERTTDHRSLEVTKFRGSDYAGGQHTYRIRSGTGAHVYPKLTPDDHYRQTARDQLRSGLDPLDSLLGGGIERGSVTVISGPSGAGKTTIGSFFLQAAARRSEKAQGYLFEELRPDYLHRSAKLGLSLESHIDEGVLHVEEIESLSQSPDEFAHRVRTAVEDGGVEVVMIDGVAGYRLGLRGNDSRAELTRELHALCRYLKRMGVTVILIEEVTNITGDLTATDEQISYLADNILFLRYIEVDGEIRKTIGVLKKRFGDFERSLRELSIGSDGVRVGEKLTGLHGILTGVPERTPPGD